MEDIFLNKYQLAWKTEKTFRAEKISEIEIHNFMRSASKILGQYRRSLFFDIVLKTLLILSFLVLIFLQKNQSIVILVNTIFILIAGFGIIWQTKVYKRVSKISIAKQNIKDLLGEYIDFYNQHYVKSIFVSALSGTLFFLAGSLFYLHFKYEQIPTFEFDDFIVLATGIILSYGLGSFAQIKQNGFQIKQLETCLVEIEENIFSTLSIKKNKSRRIKNIITIGIAFILGVILFFFLII